MLNFFLAMRKTFCTHTYSNKIINYCLSKNLNKPPNLKLQIDFRFHFSEQLKLMEITRENLNIIFCDMYGEFIFLEVLN